MIRALNFIGSEKTQTNVSMHPCCTISEKLELVYRIGLQYREQHNDIEQSLCLNTVSVVHACMTLNYYFTQLGV